MTTLTEHVLEYQRTGAGLQRLVDQVSVLVYQFPQGQPGLAEEDGAEFLLRFVPRIRGLIERYQEEGPFESYLAATLRWQVKTFAAERSSGSIRLSTLSHAALEQPPDEGPERMALEAHEERQAYGDGPARRPAGPAGNRTASRATCRGARRTGLLPGQARRLMFLALKMSERLDESDYRRLATVLGFDPEWLVLRWHELRAVCCRQRDRRSVYRARRDRAWFRMRCLQYRLSIAQDEDVRKALTREIKVWRHRYGQARKILSRMQDGPSHAQIAAALGIPKGTVDSGVFYAKRDILDDALRERLVVALSNA